MRRKLILTIISLAALASIFLAARLILNYFGTGQLKVATKPGAVISVASGEVKHGQEIKLGKTPLSKRLKPGVYRLKASTKKGIATTVVEIKKQQTSSVNLSVTDTKTAEVTANYTASDLFADHDSVDFLNLPQSNIYHYHLGDNEATPLMSDPPFGVNFVSWIGPNHGVGITDQGGLVEVTPENYSEMNVTSFNGGGVSSVVTNSRGQIAAISGKGVYLFDSPSTSPHLVFQDTSRGPLAALSGDDHLLIYHEAASYADEQNTTTPAQVIDLKTGHSDRFTPAANVTRATWSPDNKQILYEARDNTYVYNFSSKKNRRLTAFGGRGGIWLDNSRVALLADNAVWEIDTSAGTGKLLANITQPVELDQPLFLSADGDFLYICTSQPGGFGTVGRILRVSTH